MGRLVLIRASYPSFSSAHQLKNVINQKTKKSIQFYQEIRRSSTEGHCQAFSLTSSPCRLLSENSDGQEYDCERKERKVQTKLKK